jgi:hypothetical protein
MNPADDEATEMLRLPFDSSTAERFLAGGVAPEDAPPGLRDVAMLVQAAKPPASAGGGAVEDQMVAAFAGAVRTPVGTSGNVYEGKKRMLTKLLSAKAAAIAGIAAVAVLGGGAAAAAAGSLPAPVQSAVSSGLTHVGISVPHPNRHASPHAGLGAGNAKGQGSAPGNSGPASTADAYGQCTAWAAATKDTGSSGASSNAQDTFPKLTADAAAKGETIAQFCATVSRPSKVPATSGSSDSSSGTGPPSSVRVGPPSSVPVGPPSSVPVGPPSSVPVGPPSSVPVGPPSSVPARGGAAKGR